MRYNNVCIVKLNHHFIALGMRRIDSKSPNGEKGYMYVHIKHVIFQGRTSGLKSTSATSGLQDFLLTHSVRKDLTKNVSGEITDHYDLP